MVANQELVKSLRRQFIVQGYGGLTKAEKIALIDEQAILIDEQAERIAELKEVAESLREWIDALPSDTRIDVEMPGIDRDYVDSVLK